VKSGFATAVVLAGPVAAPRVIERRRIDLSDPGVPEARQPYHASFGTARTDAAKLDSLVRSVELYARRSVGAWIRELRAGRHDLRIAALVVGSDIDPAGIANPHIRAHASEGRLFRRVTEEALRSEGLACSVWVERILYAGAAKALGRSEAQVKRTVTELGRVVTGGWRAEDKAAAVAAWAGLAGVRTRRG
jgi:hypothetical protein